MNTQNTLPSSSAEEAKIALSVEHLSVTYDQTQVLWDVSFSVPEGHLVAIVGPNGAGKSTLIKALLGFVQPVGGAIRFYGAPHKNMVGEIGYVPQRESVDWHFPITVEELVLMGRYGKLSPLQRIREADREAAKRYLSLVQLEPFAHRQISQLSGGQQQRAFLARALMQEASIYFLDEPLAGIDHTSELLIMDLLHKLSREGKTLFVVHHDLESVKTYYDWAILLNAHLVACGSIDQAFTTENLRKTYGRHFGLLEEAQLTAKQIHGGRGV
ncbi:MAG: metal ABC transporter ATP-binding protein [Chlamydiia bacterium]|nr:metal ABC transporter ATP-binding protein [Chlamydiia bacterium]